ncbi:hypothetical protein MKW92_052365 [Papaver armeniacum]|nr:hypothetical protein MKW92_052365 [Papaver armeniacum]
MRLAVGGKYRSKGLPVSETDYSNPIPDGSRCLRSRIVPPRPPKFTTKDCNDIVRPYAMDAIHFYNEKQGTKFELVEPGYLSNAYIGRGFLHHVDFTARETDVADAPEEMFFAELRTIQTVRHVECCKRMGPKKSISGDKNNGCLYCEDDNSVQHPRDGGFMSGHEKLSCDE